MNQFIIKTKLSIPPYRENSVSRPALISRLSDGLIHNKKLTLVSAPPGYGKTSLIVEWSKKSETRFLWLALDKGDNEPVRFFSYFIAALRQYDSDTGIGAQSLLGSPQFPPPDMLAGALVNEIAEFPDILVLVLDDFQYITDESIIETLRQFIDAQPLNFHLVIVTRKDPAIPLPRLRATGALTEIREEDLRFSFHESNVFLKGTMDLELADEQVRMLEAGTEGWAAGLQLAALSIRGMNRESIPRFFEEFNGTQRYIIDYLFDEVFKQLPPEIREFLAQTSILDRFCSSLCNEVLNRDDSAFYIERIQNANLFLFQLDEFGQWYRYHALFRDILRTELSREMKKELHYRAALWFDKNELYDEAMFHAAEAQGYDLLENLLVKTAWMLIQRGEIRILLDRIKALPTERIRSSDEIRMFLAWCHLLTGNGKEAAVYMNEIDLTELVRYRPEIKANILILQIFKSVTFKELAPLRLPEQSSEYIGSSDPVLRTAALYCTAQIASFRGDLERSVKYYDEAFENALSASQYFLAMISAKNLAITQLLRGRKREAANLCNKALERLVDAKGKLLPAAAILYVPLGMAYYSEDNLQKAFECFEKGVSLCKRLSLIHFAIQGEMSYALLKFALHDIEGAIQTIHCASGALKEIGMDIGLPMFTAVEAELYLRNGDLQFARRWADAMGFDKSEMLGVLDERQYFTYARVLIAEGRHEEALTILNRLGAAAETGGRIYRQITAHILKAVAFMKMDLRDSAAGELKKAIELASSEDFFRLFLDEDPCIAPLLAKVRDADPVFVDKLAMKYGQELLQPDLSSGKLYISGTEKDNKLTEPLSAREIEVLKLVASGLSNKEIADRLFISLGTTKWHITNIFSKLGIKNRVQAAEAAKKLVNE